MSAPAESAPSAPLTLDTLDITTTELYVKHGYPWEAWDLLRREAPVFWYERPGFEPFWAITKYKDIAWISRNPQTFSNRQLLRLAELQPYSADLERREDEDRRYRPANDEPPDLVFMDPPEHRQYRAIVSKWFTLKAMRILEPHLQDMSQSYVGTFGRILVDRLRERQGDVTDFVHECAAKLPVATICEMADVPQADWEQIFRWWGEPGANWSRVLGGASAPHRPHHVPEKRSGKGLQVRLKVQPRSGHVRLPARQHGVHFRFASRSPFSRIERVAKDP